MIPTSTDVTVTVKSAMPADADAVVVLIHKKSKAKEILGGLLAAFSGEAYSLLESGIAIGRSNEITTQLVVDNGKARRLILIGLGETEKISCQCFREAGGTLAKWVHKQKLISVAVVMPTVPASLPGIPGAAAAGVGSELAAAGFAAGFLLGSFKYTEYKGTAQKDAAPPQSTRLTIVSAEGSTVADAVERAVIISHGQNFARTIASRPGNNINPPSLAKVAQQLAKEVGLKFRALDEKEMARLGMGGILAVGAGSNATPPRMIVMEHAPLSNSSKKSASKSTRQKFVSPLLVVGKAITFDTGGISIKPADKMQRMIFDKCGGMAVLGLMYAAAKLKLPIPIVGILTSAENHISETAYRPGDILKMYNGVTVEVTNTDAEGRLVLGDALAWGIETFKPSAVVDLATLTGGVVVALGKTMAGVMGNSDALMEELNRAGQSVGEKMWRLPIGEDQRDYIRSDPADIVNAGGREGSPLQGGAFLSFFVPEDGSVPWAHLDIAGVADTEKEMPYYAKGSTGWGVQTLVEWATMRANGNAVKVQSTPPPAGG